MEAIAILAALAFTANKLTTFIKAAVARDGNIVITQGVVWLVSIFVIALAAQAQFTEALVVPHVGIALGDLNGWSLVLLGLMLGSSGSFAYDIKAAIDGNDTAAEPRILPATRTKRRT